jgi:Zn-dependent alcohol dehydrogenase
MKNKILTFNSLVLEGKRKLCLRKIDFRGKLEKGQVLVKLYYSGICGKQVEEFNFQKGKDKFLPHMLGHEGSAKVVQIGSGVKNIAVGDNVIMHWVKNKKIQDSSTPKYFYHNSNRKINAGWITTFSEYSIVSSNRLTKINKNINLKLAALLGCCLSTGIGTVLNQSGITKKHNALVVGAGGVGLSIIKGLRIKKIKNITILDNKILNLKKAKKVGANYLMHADNLKKEKNKYNKIFICTGAKSAIENALNFADRVSDIYFIGVPNPKLKILFRPFDIHNGVKLHPSSGGLINPRTDLAKYAKLLNNNKSFLKNFVINEIQLQNAPKILKKMNSGKLSHGRNLIKF